MRARRLRLTSRSANRCAARVGPHESGATSATRRAGRSFSRKTRSRSNCLAHARRAEVGQLSSDELRAVRRRRERIAVTRRNRTGETTPGMAQYVIAAERPPQRDSAVRRTGTRSRCAGGHARGDGHEPTGRPTSRTCADWPACAGWTACTQRISRYPISTVLNTNGPRQVAHC